jgi:hypothetical protein
VGKGIQIAARKRHWENAEVEMHESFEVDSKDTAQKLGHISSGSPTLSAGEGMEIDRRESSV